MVTLENSRCKVGIFVRKDGGTAEGVGQSSWTLLLRSCRIRPFPFVSLSSIAVQSHRRKNVQQETNPSSETNPESERAGQLVLSGQRLDIAVN
jgi:hypothetical protein